MVRLGLDIFSLRSQQWTPFQHLDFCEKWGVTVAHYSERRLVGNWDRDHLRRVRGYAEERGIGLELGMLSICPSSAIFDESQGTAEEQLIAGLEAAREVGSPLIRCVVGTIDDRRSPGGIDARMADAVKVLRRVRSRVLDAGLKVAVENHAGDMQARELERLVLDAGPEYVGVCIDAGNAVWALEDPHLTLETLAPYVLTSHTRDSAVWQGPRGAAVAWTPMGKGNVRIGDYLRAFVEKCPGRPLSLEIIVLPEPRPMNYLDADFWHAYRQMPAWEFARFLALAGGPLPIDGAGRAVLTPREKELEDVEASLRWTKEFLATLS